MPSDKTMGGGYYAFNIFLMKWVQENMCHVVCSWTWSQCHHCGSWEGDH